MNHLKNIILAVAAGMCIGIGGTVYLSVDNKIIGSCLFSLGLIMITVFKLNLFTGKVCFILSNKASYIIFLIEVWIGNFIGTTLTALMLRYTRLDIYPVELVDLKLNDGLLSIFILAVLCGVLMYCAVVGFEKTRNYIVLIIPVSVFILCGFEHCVANMFYFSLCNVWNAKSLLYLLVMTLGNLLGSIIMQLTEKLNKKTEQ
jgi:Formate/nitrite family of transporters